MPADTCAFCDGKFETDSARRDHMWDVHQACHYCDEKIGDEDKEMLYRHWMTVHGDELEKRDRRRAESVVDEIGFSDRLSEQGVGAAVGGLPRRYFLLAGGVTAAAGATGGAIMLSSTGDGGGGTVNLTGPVATAPVPDSRADSRYAVMGTGDASVTATYFGSWKCPACRQFSTGSLSEIVSKYVTTGKLNLRFRHLAYFGDRPFLGPDAPAAGHAGLEVWNLDPSSYWEFHEYVFKNQPPEGRQWATPGKLASFAKKVGISETGAIKQAVRQNKYEDELRATSTRAGELGIRSTPSLVIGEKTVNPLQTSRAESLIEDAISE